MAEDRQGDGGDTGGGGSLDRIRTRWSRSSVLAKLGVIAMPIFVGVVGVVVPKILDPDPTPNERLEVAGVEIADWDTDPTTLDIRLRNVGDQIAVVNAVQLTVRDVLESTLDGCFQGGADLPPAPAVDVTLPASGSGQKVVTAKVSRQLAPNSADRIMVRLWPNEEHLNFSKARFYLLELGIVHEGGSEPLTGPTIVVAAPFPSPDVFADANLEFRVKADPSQWPPAVQKAERACHARNRAILRAAAAFDGLRSERLAQFMRDPGSFDPASPTFDRETALVLPPDQPRDCDVPGWYAGSEDEILARLERAELLLTPGRGDGQPCIPSWQLNIQEAELNRVIDALPSDRDDGQWIDWFHTPNEVLAGETPYAALILGRVSRVVFAAQNQAERTSGS